MQVHRTARQRFFTTLGNEVLRDNRLSFCARGILCHLLSLPEGQRGDIRTLAEQAPEGRERVASAMRELEFFGYLRRTLQRTPNGQVYTQVDVFDHVEGTAAQVAPNAGDPGPGDQAAGPDGDNHLKELDEETTHPPSPPSPSSPAADEPLGRAEEDDVEETTRSTEVLSRVARVDARLRLGEREAVKLAPLVTEWRRRGASDLHIISTLTIGLPPSGVYHPARFLETRLVNKMPAERVAPPERIECEECRAPVVVTGPGRRCRKCRDATVSRSGALTDFANVRARGASLARAALRGLPITGPALAPG